MSFGGPLTDTLRDCLSVANEHSRVLGALRRVESTLTRWTRGSRIIQWFLAEPDPEVIVIDLRETYTVGPIIRALDWTTVRADRLAERTGLTTVYRRTVKRLQAEPLRVAGWLLFGCALGALATSYVSGDVTPGWLVVAGLALLVTRERRSAAELAETRAGRALIAVFEPPEPPEKRE